MHVINPRAAMGRHSLKLSALFRMFEILVALSSVVSRTLRWDLALATVSELSTVAGSRSK